MRIHAKRRVVMAVCVLYMVFLLAGCAKTESDSFVLAARPIEDNCYNVTKVLDSDTFSLESTMIPEDIIVVENNLIISNSDSDQLIVYDIDTGSTTHVGETGNQNGEFIYPCGLACDKNNNIYVVDSGNQRIQVFNDKFEWVSSISCDKIVLSPQDQLLDVAVDSEGNVYVSTESINPQNACVYAFSKDGKMEKLFDNEVGILCSDGDYIYFASSYDLYEDDGSRVMGSGSHEIIQIQGSQITKRINLPDSYTPFGIFAYNHKFYMSSMSFATLDVFDPVSLVGETLFTEKMDMSNPIQMTGIAYSGEQPNQIYVIIKNENAIYQLSLKQ